MFNFSGGLLAGQHDCRKERPPPSRPIPVTFPSLSPPSPSLSDPPSSWSDENSRGIPARLLDLKKPSDVSLEILSLFNISFGGQCEFETLLPYRSNDAQPYLPPKSWLEVPIQTELEISSTPEPPFKLLSNGRRVPDRNEFYSRAKELFFENEHAFANLTRKPNGGQVPLRLAHFRKFWEGLDNLAYYWDNSLDEYLPPKPEHANDTAKDQIPSKPPSALTTADLLANGADNEPPELSSSSDIGLLNVEEPRKKAKTGVTSSETLPLPLDSMVSRSSTTSTLLPSIQSSKALPARTAPPKIPWAMNMQSITEKPADLSKGSYRGYRIGNGAEMPDQYRLDCVRAFLEPIAWAFGVTFVPHRRPPVLCIEHLRFPVRMNSVGWRGPADRMKARQGWMEGPVLGVQCRPDTNFGATGNLQAESVLDVVRELGGMLLLAQERAREGRTEVKAGEGKWWTSKPRWGGGPGGEVGEATGASDAPAQDSTPKVEQKPIGRPRVGSKDRRRPTPAEVWKILRPGNPLWDPKIVYEAIGKDRNSEWDEIFMVSSLNHHISVLKLRVHRLYLQYLEQGTLPKDTPSDPDWCSPTLQRTQWYDLFSIKDRTEAMRGIWGIMAYLMRPQEQQREDDVAMKET